MRRDYSSWLVLFFLVLAPVFVLLDALEHARRRKRRTRDEEGCDAEEDDESPEAERIPPQALVCGGFG